MYLIKPCFFIPTQLILTWFLDEIIYIFARKWNIHHVFFIDFVIY